MDQGETIDLGKRAAEMENQIMGDIDFGYC